MQKFYSILDIPPNATKDQLKSQYRKLVRECHPDQFSEPDIKLHYEEKLKEINQAYTLALQSRLSPKPQIKSEAIFNKILGSRTSIFMSFTILFISTIVGLLLPTITSPKVTEMDNQQSAVEIALDNPKQSVSPQNDSFQNEMYKQIPKIIVQTPKLGSPIHPIAPLHIKAISTRE